MLHCCIYSTLACFLPLFKSCALTTDCNVNLCGNDYLISKFMKFDLD